MEHTGEPDCLKCKQQKIDEQEFAQKLLGGRDRTDTYIPRSEITEDRAYFTHDNGNRPFLVRVSKSSISIFTYRDDDYRKNNYFDNMDPEPFYTHLVVEYNDFQGYWPGFDVSEVRADGCSILIHLGDKRYVEVGGLDGIYSFTTNEPIIDYVALMVRNDVPEPVAFAEDSVYLMTEQCSIGKDALLVPAVASNTTLLVQGFYGPGKDVVKDDAKWSGFRKESEKIMRRRMDVKI